MVLPPRRKNNISAKQKLIKGTAYILVTGLVVRGAFSANEVRAAIAPAKKEFLTSLVVQPVGWKKYPITKNDASLLALNIPEINIPNSETIAAGITENIPRINTSFYTQLFGNVTLSVQDQTASILSAVEDFFSGLFAGSNSSPRTSVQPVVPPVQLRQNTSVQSLPPEQPVATEPPQPPQAGLVPPTQPIAAEPPVRSSSGTSKYITVEGPTKIVNQVVDHYVPTGVTQDELNQQLNALLATLTQEIADVPRVATPTSSGGYTVPATPTQLSNLTNVSSNTGTFQTISASGTISAASFVGDGSQLTGVTASVAAGHTIPLTASTTNWDNFYNEPSSQIIAGTGLSWCGNTLNATGGGSGTLAVTGGGTGLSTTPAYGQLLVGNNAGGYSLTGTSSLGLLTTNITEGSNLYYTNARADARIDATSTLANLTSAANLSTVGTLASGTWHASTIGVLYGGTGSTTLSGILIGNGTSPVSSLTVGSGLSLTGTTLSATNTNNGTVTSVSGAGGTTGLTFTGGPITSSGTLTLGGTLGVIAGGTGLSTTPAYGQLLVGNGSSGFNLMATSSLGISGSQWTTNGSNINYATGDVGIGTSSPTQPLSVSGNAYVAGSLEVVAPSSLNYATVMGDITGNARGLHSIDVQSCHLVATDVASGATSTAFGINNTASGATSVALGICNTASVSSVTAVGSNNIACGVASSAFGRTDCSTSYGSLAVGLSDTASGCYSGAIGFSDISSASSSLAVGTRNTACAAESTASGYHNYVTGMCGTAVGVNNTVAGCQDSAFGFCNTTYNLGNVAVGNRNNASAVCWAQAVGQCNSASGNYASAFGFGNCATTRFSAAFGSDNTASGYEDSVFGIFNSASSYDSSAIGLQNTVNGQYSAAIGYDNHANGSTNDYLIGGNNQVTSTCDTGDVAMGYYNTVSGASSAVTLGISNFACGNGSSAVGLGNGVCGVDSAAIGFENLACGPHSSAIGVGNTVSGNYASALGYNNNLVSSASGGTVVGYDNIACGGGIGIYGAANNINTNNSLTWGNGNTITSCFGCYGCDNCASAFGFNNCICDICLPSWDCNCGQCCYGTYQGFCGDMAFGCLNTLSSCGNMVFGVNDTAGVCPSVSCTNTCSTYVVCSGGCYACCCYDIPTYATYSLYGNICCGSCSLYATCSLYDTYGQCCGSCCYCCGSYSLYCWGCCGSCCYQNGDECGTCSVYVPLTCTTCSVYGTSCVPTYACHAFAIGENVNNCTSNSVEIGISDANKISINSCGLCLIGGSFFGDGSQLTGVSDVNKKTNFVKLNPADVLQKVDSMNIEQWSYKTDPKINHVGPFAQDFYSAFNLGDSSTTISFIDPSGVALVAIQGLSEQVASTTASTTAKIENLNSELAPLVAKEFSSTTVQVTDLSSLSSTWNSYIDGATQWLFTDISAVTGYFKNIFADTITANKVTTQTLCLDDVCLTKDQLQNLINMETNSSAGTTTSATASTTQSAVVITTVGSGSESTSSSISTSTTDVATSSIDMTSSTSTPQTSVVPTPSVVPSATSTDPAPSVSPAPDASGSPQPTPSPLPSTTPSPSPTPTATPTPTPTFSPSPTATPTPDASPSSSPTPTNS